MCPAEPLLRSNNKTVFRNNNTQIQSPTHKTYKN